MVSKLNILVFVLTILFCPGVHAQDPPWLLVEKGKVALENRNLSTALEFLLDAVEAQSDYPEAEFWLGQVYLAQGQVSLAEEQFHSALGLSVYLQVPEDAVMYRYRLSSLYDQRGPEFRNKTELLLRSIADIEGASEPDELTLEHSYMRILSAEGPDQLLFLYRDSLDSSMRARRELAELAWDNRDYRSTLLNSTRVFLSTMSILSQNIRELDPTWRFDIDLVLDTQNPDRDVRFPETNDGSQALVDRALEDGFLSDWLSEEGFWPNTYLLGVALFSEGYEPSARSIWELLVLTDKDTGVLSPRPISGRWGRLALAQLREPFIPNGPISP